MKRPPYCFWYVRMRSGSKWPMIGLRLCAYVDPVFTSQSYDISISTSTRRTKLSVFLVLMLMLTQFSRAYICAYAYAYTYVLMKIRLNFLDEDRDCKMKKDKLNTIFSEKRTCTGTFLKFKSFYFTFINKTLDIIWSVFQKLIKTMNFLWTKQKHP